MSSKQLTETLSISHRQNGWWLWDKTRGMNLSMQAPTEQAAFTEALTYYQKRLKHVEKEYKELSDKVDAFVNQIIPPTEDEDY